MAMMDRMRLNTAFGALLLGTVALTSPAQAQDKTEITLARFFGTCESDYGTSTDVAKARGECGVMTTLVNLFNSTHADIVVKPQITEWGPYYQQLTARFAARDVPTIAVMHSSQIGDFVRARVVTPIGDELKEAGIDSAEFTPNARAGVTMDDKVYAMPWDTHSWLWHINVNYFKQAGLVDAQGQPIIPKSVDEMLAQAKQVQEKTGKPYIVMATTGSGDQANAARGYYSWLYDQNGTIFPSGYDKADFRSPASVAAFGAWQRLAQAGAVTRGLDSGGALSSFLNGGGAVYMTGTWRIDDLLAGSEKPGSPLAEGYTVRVFPSLFGEQHVWTDNHSWVLPRGGSDAKTRKAALVFLKFMWDHNFDWARGGGHLPARQSVMADYAKLPLRQYVVDIPSFGRAAPHEVRRQFGFQTVIGDEISAMINTGKTAEQAEAGAQDRSEQLLRGR
jgi:multiple sugar transport system substrate-binding protein